jgi:hypothetical protein
VKRVLRSFAAYRILYGAEPHAPVELRLARRAPREAGPGADGERRPSPTPRRRGNPTAP